MARRAFSPYGEYDPMQYGGHGADPTGSGTMDPYNRSGAQVARDRYRSLGSDDNGIFGAKQNPQLQFGKAEANEAQSLQARGNQTEALGMLKGAAQGNAPSEAAILGNQAASQSIQDAMRAQAGARSPAAQGAAGAGALRGMQNAQTQSVANYAGARSSEIGQDLGAFNAGAGAIRKQDYGNQGLAQQRAEAQASNELAYRDMNQRRQIGYERLAYGATENDLANNTRLQGLRERAYQDAKEREANNQRQNLADAQTAASFVGMAFSDKRTKQVLPPSALAKMKDEAETRIAAARAGVNSGGTLTSQVATDDSKLEPTNRDVDFIRYGGHQDSNVDRGDVNEIALGDRSPGKGYQEQDVDQIAGRGKGDLSYYERNNRLAYGAGPQKAPEGYAAEHPTKSGDYSLKGLGLSEGEAFSPSDKVAPGTEDWKQYGAPGKVLKKDYSFDPGGRLLTGPDGFGPGSDVKRMDDYSKSIVMSDERAKQEAFLDGMKYGQGQVKELPGYMPKQSASSVHAKKSDTVPRTDPSAQNQYVRARDTDEKTLGSQRINGVVLGGLGGGAGAAGVAYGGSLMGAADGALEGSRSSPVPAGQKYKLRSPKEFKRDDPTPLSDSPVEGPMREDRLREVPIPSPKNTPDEDHPWAASDERTKEDAALKLDSKPYTYKDEYVPGDQEQGEVNYGPMAQEMEKNPITATTVKTDPKTGMRMVDMMKLTKVHSGLISNLQKEISQLKYGGGHGR